MPNWIKKKEKSSVTDLTLNTAYVILGKFPRKNVRRFIDHCDIDLISVENGLKLTYKL